MRLTGMEDHGLRKMLLTPPDDPANPWVNQAWATSVATSDHILALADFEMLYFG